MLPDVLVVEDVARVSHASVAAVRDWIRSGLLPARKLGKRWLISRTELMRLLASPDVTPRFEVLK
jgi:excisionase family DNA binding protein